MASGVPYATWDGGEYLVRVDLDPDDAREIHYLLARTRDGAAPAWWDAAERVDILRSGRDHDDPAPVADPSGSTGGSDGA